MRLRILIFAALFCSALHGQTFTVAGGSGLATNGSSTGATAQSQVFTNGIQTAATTGVVGIGTAPQATTALDINVPAGFVGVFIHGTKPATVNGFGTGKFAHDISGAAGGDSSSSSANKFAGDGQGVEWTLGVGGDITGTGNSSTHAGAGGGFTVIAGAGGNATGATGGAKGYHGGDFIFTGGGGGNATTHAGIAGRGSNFSFIGAAGADNSISGGTAGDGSLVQFEAGLAGVASGGASAGTNGSINLGITSSSKIINIGNTASITTITGQIVTAGTTPVVSNTTANSCGTTAATIAGNDSTGVITVGATAGTNCTITFVVAAPTRRQCTVTNETTANLSRSTYLTTTTSTVEGTFVAGDLISYVCSVY